MTTLAAPSTAASPLSSSRPLSAVRLQALVAGLVLAAFVPYSLWVVYREGYTGFLTLAGREPWAMQLLLDLALALWISVGWMRGDARKRGLAWWPYVPATLLFGSIGVLLYVVRRGFATPPRAA